MQRVIGFLFLALVVWLIITQPTTAAHAVNTIGSLLKTAANSIITFFSQLVQPH